MEASLNWTMVCDARISSQRTTRIIFRCYTCNRTVDPQSLNSLESHKDCEELHNDEWVLKVNVETQGGNFYF